MWKQVESSIPSRGQWLVSRWFSTRTERNSSLAAATGLLNSWMRKQAKPNDRFGRTESMLHKSNRVPTENYSQPPPWTELSRSATLKTVMKFTPLSILRGPHNPFLSVPDGKWLASGGFDPNVFIWDLKTGKLAKTIAGGGLK